MPQNALEADKAAEPALRHPRLSFQFLRGCAGRGSRFDRILRFRRGRAGIAHQERFLLTFERSGSKVSRPGGTKSSNLNPAEGGSFKFFSLAFKTVIARFIWPPSGGLLFLLRQKKKQKKALGWNAPAGSAVAKRLIQAGRLHLSEKRSAVPPPGGPGLLHLQSGWPSKAALPAWSHAKPPPQAGGRSSAEQTGREPKWGASPCSRECWSGPGVGRFALCAKVVGLLSVMSRPIKRAAARSPSPPCPRSGRKWPDGARHTPRRRAAARPAR